MADAHDPKITLLRAGAASPTSGRTGSWTLPSDLREEAARRTRAVALLYAAAYFLIGMLPLLISEEGRTLLFGRTIHWLPATVSIADALALAWLVGHPRVPASVKLLA